MNSVICMYLFLTEYNLFNMIFYIILYSSNCEGIGPEYIPTKGLARGFFNLALGFVRVGHQHKVYKLLCVVCGGLWPKSKFCNGLSFGYSSVLFIGAVCGVLSSLFS